MKLVHGWIMSCTTSRLIIMCCALEHAVVVPVLGKDNYRSRSGRVRDRVRVRYNRSPIWTRSPIWSHQFWRLL